MKLFTRETLKHSIKPIIIIFVACMLVWYWGNYRKVSIDLTLHAEITQPQTPSDKPQQLILTVYDAKQNVAATIQQPTSPHGSASQHISLAPGNYMLRGSVTMTSGASHTVEQSLTVPNENAAVDLYLRNR